MNDCGKWTYYVMLLCPSAYRGVKESERRPEREKGESPEQGQSREKTGSPLLSHEISPEETVEKTGDRNDGRRESLGDKVESACKKVEHPRTPDRDSSPG